MAHRRVPGQAREDRGLSTMTFAEALGLIMLFGMVAVIFIGFPDLLHAAVSRDRFRRPGTRLGADLQSRLSADLGHDEGRDLSGRAAVHLHGLHDRAGRPHGAAVRRPAQPARAGARLALSRRDSDGDDLCDGDRHRRRRRDRARHHGGADDDQDRLRRAAVSGCDRRRRHARHSDPAQRHAGGHGPGHGRARQSALFGSVRARASCSPAATSPIRSAAASSIRSSVRP